MLTRKNELLHYPLIWTISFILIWSFLYFFWGGIIHVSQGCGYDGAIYCVITKKLGMLLQHKGLSWYYASRVLPCGVVYFSLQLLDIPIIKPNIITTFHILNTIMWVLALFFWNKILIHYKISKSVQWLMTILIVLNFYVLKFIFYYPVLTDSMAFFFGVLLLWFYLQNKLIPLFIVGFLSSFIYPLFFIYTFILIILPVNVKLAYQEKWKKNTVDYFIIGFLAFLFVIARTYTAYRAYPSLDIIFHLDTVLYVCMYVIIWYYIIIPPYKWAEKNIIYLFSYLIKKNTLMRVGLAICLLIITMSIKFYISQNPALNNPPSMFLFKPLLGIGYHSFLWITEYFSAFGLIAVFVVLFAKKINQVSYTHSIGFYAIMLFIFILKTMRPETRGIIDIYPFMLLAVALTLENEKSIFTRGGLFLFAIINLLLSKFFLPIENSSVFWNTSQKILIYTNYGLSTYLMNDGQYIVILIVFSVFTGVLYMKLRKIKSQGT